MDQRDRRNDGSEQGIGTRAPQSAPFIAPGKVTPTSKLAPHREPAVQRKPAPTGGGAPSGQSRSSAEHTMDMWMDAAHRGVTAQAERGQNAVQAQSSTAPVQMVAQTDVGKILPKVRRFQKEYGLAGKPIIPRQKAKDDTAAFWAELAAMAQSRSRSLADMNEEEAARFFLENKKAEVEASQPTGEVPTSAPQEIVLDPPLTLLDAEGKAVPGHPVDFEIPGLGKGRISLFRGIGKPSYENMLAWMSHGIQNSDASLEAKQSRTFGFVVDPNAKMKRHEGEDNKLGELAEQLATKAESKEIPEQESVPDMLVSMHNQTEFNEGMRKSAFRAVSKCDVAILSDFQPYADKDQRFGTTEMAFFDYRYPPLKEVLENTPALDPYKNLLMLCCRSKTENVVAGKDRPEQDPGTVRAFGD